MFRSKKVWWTVSVLIISLYIPGTLHAAMRFDRYKHTILIGKVEFRYLKSKQDYSDRGDRDYSSLYQNYTLDITGNLLNRLLIIYDAGIRYKMENINDDNVKSNRDFLEYYLETTFLPKSAIPLTLHGRRTTISDLETDIYGLRWTGKFQTLPKTDVSVYRRETTGTNSKLQDTNYRLSLRKDLGRSTNEFDYSLSKDVDKITSKESSVSAMNFTNKTKISRSTSFDFGVARGASEGDDIEKSTIEGMNAYLYLLPRDGLMQTHSYFYNKNQLGSSQDLSEQYQGRINYNFSPSLTSKMQLDVLNRESDSTTLKSEVDRLTTVAELRYRASRKLSLTEEVRYETTDFSGSDTGQTNLSDRTRLEIRTAASYHTNLSWANMSSTYTVGYLEESQTGEDPAGRSRTGKALNQSIFLALGNMDAMGYATVTVSGKYGFAEAFEGDITGKDTILSIFATNRVWKDYIDLFASYKSKDIRSWLTVNTQKNDELIFTGETEYLTKYLNPGGNGRTGLRFTGRRRTDFDNFEDKRTNTSLYINIRHQRKLLRGLLSGSITYSNMKSKFASSTIDTLTSEYRAEYKRWLLRRILWNAKILNTSRTVNGYKSVTTSISNKFKYRLRVWSFGAEHEYIMTRYPNSKSNENRIMLTASRSFMRLL